MIIRMFFWRFSDLAESILEPITGDFSQFFSIDNISPTGGGKRQDKRPGGFGRLGLIGDVYTGFLV